MNFNVGQIFCQYKINPRQNECDFIIHKHSFYFNKKLLNDIQQKQILHRAINANYIPVKSRV